MTIHGPVLYISETRYYPLSVVIEDVAIDEDLWFLANVKHSGFYRVAYDSITFQQLADQLVENPYVSINGMVCANPPDRIYPHATYCAD